MDRSVVIEVWKVAAVERLAGERDRIVAEHLRGLGCKTILVMAGGYGDYKTIAEMHADTIAAICGTY